MDINNSLSLGMTEQYPFMTYYQCYVLKLNPYWGYILPYPPQDKHCLIYTVEPLYIMIQFSPKCSQKTLHSACNRARNGVSFVSFVSSYSGLVVIMTILSVLFNSPIFHSDQNIGCLYITFIFDSYHYSSLYLSYTFVKSKFPVREKLMNRALVTPTPDLYLAHYHPAFHTMS